MDTLNATPIRTGARRLFVFSLGHLTYSFELFHYEGP